MRFALYSPSGYFIGEIGAMLSTELGPPFLSFRIQIVDRTHSSLRSGVVAANILTGGKGFRKELDPGFERCVDHNDLI
jgi:hypothetical protein